MSEATDVLPSSSGTGASCIYPLLGATMNGWYFLATEVDDICFDYAKKNVEQNNLSDLVKGECWLKHGVDVTAVMLRVFCFVQSSLQINFFPFYFAVVKVPQKTLLMDALKEETEIIYDFCMCNPPFFANQLEAKVTVHLLFFFIQVHLSRS